MLKFKVNKIVRDKSYADMASECAEVINEELSVAQFQQALKLKLEEECAEVHETEDKAELTEELADVLEVVEAIAKTYDITIDDIHKVKADKLKRKGGFNTPKNCLYLVADPKNSAHRRLIKYCQDKPEKYPEL